MPLPTCASVPLRETQVVVVTAVALKWSYLGAKLKLKKTTCLPCSTFSQQRRQSVTQRSCDFFASDLLHQTEQFCFCCTRNKPSRCDTKNAPVPLAGHHNRQMRKKFKQNAQVQLPTSHPKRALLIAKEPAQRRAPSSCSELAVALASPAASVKASPCSELAERYWRQLQTSKRLPEPPPRVNASHRLSIRGLHPWVVASWVARSGT